MLVPCSVSLCLFGEHVCVAAAGVVRIWDVKSGREVMAMRAKRNLQLLKGMSLETVANGAAWQFAEVCVTRSDSRLEVRDTKRALMSSPRAATTVPSHWCFDLAIRLHELLFI